MGSSISSSNYYSVSASSNNGIAGLVSGMDTDSMVKQMLSGTQAKIDAKKQEQQQLQWKQEQYQDVISAINSFSSKYFDTTYGSTLATNLSSSALFNSMVSSIKSGSSVKLVSTGTSAATGINTIKVNQLASATKLQSSQKMSGRQTITGTGIDVDKIKSRLAAEEDFTFDLTLDGIKKTVNLSASDISGEVNEDSIITALKSKTEKAFGNYIELSNDGNKLTFDITITGSDGTEENGHELTITGSDASYLGITPGASTLVTGSTKLGSLSGINGDNYKFSINGTDFSFGADTSISKMINTINSSSAGVRMTYSSMTDTFSMEQTSTGAGFGISMTQESGNLLSLVFGSNTVAEGASVGSRTFNKATIQGQSLASGYTTTEATMKMKVNGTEYTFSLPRESGTTYDKDTVENKLNTWLRTNFGTTADGTANISYADGVLNTKQGYEVSFAATDVNTDDAALAELAGKNNLAIALGFSKISGGATNAVTGETELSSINELSGVSFLKSDGTAATKLSEIATLEYNGQSITASYTDGRIKLTGAGTYVFSGSDKLTAMFGSSVTLGSGSMNAESTDAGGKKLYNAGTDAQVEINGVLTSRSSNTFSFDGITVTAAEVSSEATVIDTTRDTEKIIDTIKSFVNDYNTLIEDLYGRVTQDADYRDYKPLTSEQEDDMSDKQIELWEKKAKTGLLRGDTDMNTLIDSMRSAVYTTADSAGIALFSLGIESTSWNGAGKLTIDEDVLRTAVEASPETIASLFTDKTNGVAKTLSKACDAAAKISLSNTGALVAKAGAKDWTAGAKHNDIYDDLQRIDDRLDYLNTLYQTQKTRYWNQFSQMETIMSSYNSQSSMLTNMFS